MVCKIAHGTPNIPSTVTSEITEEDFVSMLPERAKDVSTPSLDEIQDPSSHSRPNHRNTREVNYKS